METDASDYGIGAFLFQIDPDTGSKVPIQFVRGTQNERDGQNSMISDLDILKYLKFYDFQISTKKIS